MNNEKTFAEMTKQERYKVLKLIERVLENRFGEVSVYLPSFANGPIDISVSSVLLMLHNERRLMQCQDRPYAE